MPTKSRHDDADLFGLGDLDPQELERAVNLRSVEDDADPDQIADADNLLKTLRASDLKLGSPATDRSPSPEYSEAPSLMQASPVPVSFNSPTVPTAPSDRSGMIVAANGHPFNELDAANYKLRRLTEETGASFYVGSFPAGGYAIFPKQSHPTGSPAVAPQPRNRHDESRHAELSTNSEAEDSPYTPHQPKYDRRDTSVWKLEDFPEGHPVHKYGLARYKALMRKNCKVKQAYRSQLLMLIIFLSGLLFWGAPELVLSLLYGAAEFSELSDKMLFTIVNTVYYGGIIMMGYALLQLAYIRLNFRYLLAPDYAKSETGIIAKKTTKMNYTNILTVDVHISLLGRIFNYGSIELSTAGESGAEIFMKNVHYPELLQRIIEARIKEAKRSTYS